MIVGCSLQINLNNYVIYEKPMYEPNINSSFNHIRHKIHTGCVGVFRRIQSLEL